MIQKNPFEDWSWRVPMAAMLLLTLSVTALPQANSAAQNPTQQPDVFNSQGQPPTTLHGGVGINAPLDTSPMHVYQLALDIDHVMGIVGNAARRGPVYENPVAADLFEFKAELDAGSSVAQQYANCVQQYQAAYAHFLKAADLMAQYTRGRDTRSASPQSLSAINRQMNSESAIGLKLFNVARSCANQVTRQQPDLFQSQTKDGARSGPTPQRIPPVIPPSPSWTNPQLTLPQPACASYAPRGFGSDIEAWNKWKYDVTAALSQNFSASSLGSRQGGSPFVSADFDIYQDGTISIVEISNVSGGNGPQDLIAAVQRAILALSGHMTSLPFPDPQTPGVQLNVIRDPWGCFQPGGYYQLAEGRGHGGGEIHGTGDAGGGTCPASPYDVRNDVPGADPAARYTLGFETSFASCLENQVSIQNLATAALAARFRQVAAILTIAAAPGVIDGVLHPPGTSANSNPYLRGKEEGSRLCEWMSKVSPLAVRKCTTGPAGPTASACTAAEIAEGYGASTALAAQMGTKRFDCFPCTLAWLEGRQYTPPADGGAPWSLQDQIIPKLKEDYGTITPQGPPLPCWRQSAQAKGIPGTMWPIGIQNEMLRAGDGAKGIVFMLDFRTGDVGHVFGVRTVGHGADAKVIYWDEQQQMDGSLWLKSFPNAWTTFSRIK